MRKHVRFCLAGFFICVAAGGATATSTPTGWIVAGSRPSDYQIEQIASAATNGKVGVAIKSVASTAEGFGTLMQTISAESYLGKRVKLSADVRALGVDGWCGLWMRVDGAGTQPLAFDNMANRAIRGMVPWRRYDVILDVPKSATAVAFGILLNGNGSVEVDNFKLEIVPNTVATTGQGSDLPTAPLNLNLEK